MFRRRRSTFGKSIYGRSSRRKSRPLRPAAWIAIAIAVVVAAELLLRAISGLGGFGGALSSYQGEPAHISAYRLQFLSNDQQHYDGLPNTGQLKATYSPLTGYRLLPDQQNEYWTINAQTFRDDEPITVDKAANEIRIVILGGSAAFDELSDNNQAILSNRLEELLNGRIALQNSQPDQFQPEVLPFRLDLTEQALARQPRITGGQYRVINAAVPGYASGNELARLTQDVMAYKPDIVIALHGYADLLLPSSYEAAEIPGLEPFMTNSFKHFTTDVMQQVKGFFRQSYLIRAIHYWIIQPQQKPAPIRLITPNHDEALADQLAADETELRSRIQRYQRHLREMARITTNANIPFIIALQPEITGRQAESLTEQEREIVSVLGSTYQERIATGYEALAAAASQIRKELPQSRALNLYTLYASEPEEMTFQSPIHLTKEARERLASRLYDAVVETQTIEPIPFNQSNQ
ncbi:MAG: SGNH/GDSL hydrolase family protein [Thainema sp.]